MNSQGGGLRIEDVHAHYGLSHVLHGVSLEVAPVSITAVVGRNGVGKTTLIHVIMGLIPPSAGSVWVDGTDLLRLPAHARRSSRLALVPQGRRLFGSLTVAEHLGLVPSIQAGPFDVTSIYELFPALRERQGAPATTLSGGERSMLSISRALVVNPSILLMDEPTEGLAPLLVARIRGIIPELRERGLTILLVEQNLQFALAVADVIAIMGRGRITHRFRREEIQHADRLSEIILGASEEEIP